MDDPGRYPEAPAGWLEAMDESAAGLAAGRIVPGDAVRRMPMESIARIEAKQAAARQKKTAGQC